MTRSERFAAIASHGRAIAEHAEALEAEGMLEGELQSSLLLAGTTMRYAAEVAHAAAVGALQPVLVQGEGATVH